MQDTVFPDRCATYFCLTNFVCKGFFSDADYLS